MTTQVLGRQIRSSSNLFGRLAFQRVFPQLPTGDKRSYLSFLKEIALLRLGPGRLSIDDYCGLNLFDDSIYGSADKTEFIGLKSNQRIWLQANNRVDLFGLVNNKLASDILFATHGFPILPTIAVFHENVGLAGPFLLRSPDELRTFMTKSEHYPMFAKPVCGYQSIGSASLDHYDAANDQLITTTGLPLSLDAFVSFVREHSASGYMFQRRVSPHSSVRDMCGDRLATVRFLTIMSKGEPKILRACWKIPAGVNAADNFWRPGNLLAELDLANGRVVRVIRANAQRYEEVSHHPDSDILLKGMVVPNWQELSVLALEGAKLLADIPLIGWDIAPVDGGAIIVEPNMTPDLKLHQLADRRGMLDQSFRNFLDDRKKQAANACRSAKKLSSRSARRRTNIH